MTMDGAENAIRGLVESWVVWRDTGDFERLLHAWHDDGVMVTTAGEASAVEFVNRARQATANGLDAVHSVGGIAIEIAGDRAVAQSRIMISQRVSIDGLVCDVECWGRFVDLLMFRDGRWGIKLRHPAYDRDRIARCDGGAVPPLDPQILGRYPVGYRHLAYVQSLQGLPVRDDLPGRSGPAMDALSARARAWLAGE